MRRPSGGLRADVAAGGWGRCAGAYARLGGLSAGQDGRRTFVLLTASVTALDLDPREFPGEEIDLTPR